MNTSYTLRLPILGTFSIVTSSGLVSATSRPNSASSDHCSSSEVSAPRRVRREGLARRASSEESYRVGIPDRGEVVGRDVAHVFLEKRRFDVRLERKRAGRIQVNAGDDRDTGPLEAERQASRAAEQIHRRYARWPLGRFQGRRGHVADRRRVSAARRPAIRDESEEAFVGRPRDPLPASAGH